MDEIIEQILIEGTVDWNYPAWVRSCVAELRPSTPEQEFLETLRIIKAMLYDKLIVAGTIDNNGIFIPWPMSPQESFMRIQDEWQSDWNNELPTPGAIAWFDNTRKGDCIGKHLIQTQEQEDTYGNLNSRKDGGSYSTTNQQCDGPTSAT
ncbi:hypothetical protein [Acidipropionibacterium virtanenii]|uniref:hypothetical protein n=1 Tax=Acidipropionibacterium virtanenii TaxID=2057246 RepID=UPI0011BE3713|nr:hypothetical protein [Acidipropionibacterium virtanenii]